MIVIKKIGNKTLSKITGLKPIMVRMATKEFLFDFRNEKRTNIKQKIWAYKKGFTSSKIIDYGLTDKNYHDFLSDWDYYKMFPLNNKYSKWIDDKLTMKYILNKYDEFLPEYYFYIMNSKIIPSVNSSLKNKTTANDVCLLLKRKKILAFKLENGSLGTGFYKAQYNNSEFKINEKIINEDELITLINSLNGYLVTEFIENHEELAIIFPGTANSMRLTIVKDGERSSVLTNAFIRFGTKGTKVIDNVSAGGLYSIIDINSGYFEKGYRHINGELSHYDSHPDTGEQIRGTLPDWESIVDKVLEISDYLGHLTWLGFDVVITQTGFKILEINSHQDIKWYQYFYPMLRDNPATNFLEKRLK